MKFIRNALHVARLEAALFSHFPKLRMSVLGIIVIPALYAFIYLESVWDPASRTAQLPAVIVNLDHGTETDGKPVNLGAELSTSLQAKQAFGFSTMPDEAAARLAVREGRVLFALVIPPQFSAEAMGAATAGAGKLIVYASEGNNYVGAGFARRFAAELGHQLNETLNEKRWEAVLGVAANSADSLARLRDGVAQLQAGAVKLGAGLAQAHEGSGKLATGSAQLAENVALLTGGVKQLAAGTHTLDSKSPKPADLQALKGGAAQLAAGDAELQKGLLQLQAGTEKLAEGSVQLRDQTKGIPFVGGKVSASAGQLADGAGQLQSGLRTATQAQAKLAAGSQGLAKGVEQLSDGFGAYAGGVATLASKFPPDDKLDALAAGGQAAAQANRQLDGGLAQLSSGAGQLRAGLATLASALPRDVQGPPGTAQGLAASVAPVVEIDAPVASQGQAYASNFIPVALWLGATMTAFIFHLRRLPEAASVYPRATLLLGKMGVLGSINLAQAAAVLLMSAYLLGIHPAHLPALALTMVAASLTFMLIILALVRSFGDAGKAVALILMVLQLSSAGGVMPVELSNNFFRAISPWLPFTWAVRSVRTSAFGAYGSEWMSSLGTLALFGAVAFGVAMWAGRWKFVTTAEHRPAMDI